MKKPNGLRFSLSFIAILFALTSTITKSLAEVKPGDTITARNAEQVRGLVSPGTFVAVSKGMQMNIVAPSRVMWPPPYQDATEKYSAQVRLAPDHRDLIGFVAGQPFPLLDPNDPDVATKIIGTSTSSRSRPTTTTCAFSNARWRGKIPARNNH